METVSRKARLRRRIRIVLCCVRGMLMSFAERGIACRCTSNRLESGVCVEFGRSLEDFLESDEENNNLILRCVKTEVEKI